MQQADSVVLVYFSLNNSVKKRQLHFDFAKA